MGENAVDPEIIKRTQDTLGQIISAPALTEKLLNRPPVQFLQDIVKAVIKKTNFLQGLYSDEELSAAYLKEGRDNKTAFMRKLVTAVYIAVKRPPDVRVSKILAGQEADKTNLMLQALAEAIRANVDNADVVRKTLQALAGEGNEADEAPARPSERSRERRDRDQAESGAGADAQRSSKGASNDREESNNNRRTSRDGSRDQADADGGGSQSRRRRSSRPPDEGGHDERKSSSMPQRQDDDEENEKKDDDDSSRRRSSRPSSAKGPRKQQNNQQRSDSPKADPPTRAAPPPQAPSISMDRDQSDERPLARPGTASAAKGRKPMKPTPSDELSSSAGRVASAAQRGQGSLIIESKDKRGDDVDDDDDDNFVIQEEKPSISKSLKLDDFDGRDGAGADQDEADDGQHGGLVQKMLDAKKMGRDGSEIAGQRSETKAVTQNDAQRRREREKIQKDVDKLRETIQSLTKSIVPLGKVLEYLQEDYEMMAREMQQYTDEYKRTVVELRKEKFTTDQTLEPLRAALLDFDDQIADMKNRIIFMKKKISNNEKANGMRLLEIIRKSK